jgi:hypothetical protein
MRDVAMTARRVIKISPGLSKVDTMESLLRFAGSSRPAGINAANGMEQQTAVRRPPQRAA